jgi:hypothetical protein
VVGIAAIQGINLWVGAGQAIDVETGKPLEGVFVMAMWHGNPLLAIESTTACYHFAITQTGKDGSYHLPVLSWSPALLINRQRYKDVYFAGYENFSDDDLMGAVIKLRRTRDSVEKRLNELVKRQGFFGRCMSESEEKEKLLPLYKAKYEEGKRIAVTSKEKMLVETLRAIQMSTELGHDNYIQLQMNGQKP